MPTSPASGPGGGGSFNGGTITEPLIIADATGSGHPFGVHDGANLQGIDVFGTGTGLQLAVWTDGPSAPLFLEQDNAVGVPLLVDTQNDVAFSVAQFLKEGSVVIRQHAAPSDAAVQNAGLALWFDDTPGAAKLMVKARDSNGTVVTAAIALA